MDNFFVPREGDWVNEALSTIFETEGVLSSTVGLYNMIFAAIGGMMLLWLIVRVVMETGQHGSLAGKNSEVWLPIRFVMMVGLLSPLPPVGVNAAEHIVIGVARMGIAAATTIWDNAVEMTAKMKPLIVPVSPEVRELAGGLFMVELCSAIQNASSNYSNGPTITEVKMATGYSYNGTNESGGVVGQCGSVNFSGFNIEGSDDDGTKASAVKIAQAHINQTRILQTALRAAARELAPQLLPPFAGGKPVGPSIDITALMRNYTTALTNVASTEVSSGNERLAVYEAAATANGWVKAGAWGATLMQANQTLAEAVSDTPEVSGPKFEWWDGEIYQSERAAMQAGAQWWAETYAQKASTDWDAYNAVADTSSVWKITSVFDVARYKIIYDKILTEKEENPLSEMTSLGHYIIDIYWGAVVGYSTAISSSSAVEKVQDTTIIGIVVNKFAPAAALARGASEFFKAAGPAFWSLSFTMLLAGVMLAYFLPMLPALLWLYAVARYLIRVFLTVLGANVWAVAHLEMEGEGIGQRAGHGYVFLLDLLIRPMVMTISLVAGYAMLFIFGDLFSMFYYEAVRNSITGHHAGITGLVAFTFIGAVANITLCGIAFGAVSEGCDYVLGMAIWHLGNSSQAAGDAQSAEHRVGVGVQQAQHALAGSIGTGGGGKSGAASGGTSPTPSLGSSMENSVPGHIRPGPDSANR